MSPAQKLFGRPIQDTIPAHRRSFAHEWQKHGDEIEKQVTKSLQDAQVYYNQHTANLPDIGMGSCVALQHPQTKMWDIYGTVVDIGPYRRYFVKTQSGRVLTCNHRFLRRRTAASLCPTPSEPMVGHHQDAATTPSHDTQDSTQLRHSSCTQKPPSRLVEDPTWA